MNTNEKRIIDVFGDVLPKLNEVDRATLLGIAEGMAIMADRMREKEKSPA